MFAEGGGVEFGLWVECFGEGVEGDGVGFGVVGGWAEVVGGGVGAVVAEDCLGWLLAGLDFVEGGVDVGDGPVEVELVVDGFGVEDEDRDFLGACGCFAPAEGGPVVGAVAGVFAL